jgi:hypothetical protein
VLRSSKASMRTWWAQVRALTRKNFLLQYRARRSFACELLAPVVFMCLLGFLELSLRLGGIDSSPASLMTLPSRGGPLPCLIFGDRNSRYGYGYPIPKAWCVTIAYSPARAYEVNEVMSRLASTHGYDAPCRQNVSTTGSSCCGSGSCIMGFETLSTMRSWMQNNQGRVGVGIQGLHSLCIRHCVRALFSLWCAHCVAQVGVFFGDAHESVSADGTITVAQDITSTLPPHLQYEIVRLQWPPPPRSRRRVS